MSNKISCLAKPLPELGLSFLSAPDIAEFLDIWLSNELLDGGAAEIFSAYYKSYEKSFSPRMRQLYAGQLREAENIVKNYTSAAILEVGCGLGTESLWLALKGADVRAIDVRKDRIGTAIARQRVLETAIGRPVACKFSCRSFLELNDAETFDLIWMEQAFHHLEPRREVVQKTTKLLKPGGYLVISEANALNPLLQLELFIRRGIPRVEMLQGPNGTWHPYGVERITSAMILARTFECAGVRRIGVRHYRMFPNKPMFDWLASMEEFLAQNALAPLLTHFNYVGQKMA